MSLLSRLRSNRSRSEDDVSEASSSQSFTDILNNPDILNSQEIHNDQEPIAQIENRLQNWSLPLANFDTIYKK